jgi:hypothetical protein
MKGWELIFGFTGIAQTPPLPTFHVAAQAVGKVYKVGILNDAGIDPAIAVEIENGIVRYRRWVIFR